MATQHPFPLPQGNQSTWTASQHQAAANYFWYEIGGIDRTEPNYRPVLSLLESEFARHNRYAKAMRQRAAA